MRNPRVFVVEDEDVLRRGIVKRLIRHQFLVRDFDSGEALLRFYETQNEIPDVFLLDFNMPGMNGLETLEAFHKKASSISVVSAVILTAYKGAVDIEKAKSLGVCEIFTKTLEFEGLVSIVNRALADRELRMSH